MFPGFRLIIAWVILIKSSVHVFGNQCPTWELAIGKISNWQLRSCDGSYSSIAGHVPGSVHTDLIQAGVIKINPYYRYGELNLSWIPQQCWEYYSGSFDLPNLVEDCEMKIGFMNLDAVATVILNDVVVGSTVNAHRRHDLSVPSSSFRKSGNQLKISFQPALAYNKEQATQYPYEVPATQNWNVWAEPSSRPFLRKAGSDFGWDWGPAFINTGINGEIYFYQTEIAKLTGVVIHQTLTDDLHSAHVEVFATVQVTRTSEQSSIGAAVYFEGLKKGNAKLNLSNCKLNTNCKIRIAIFDVKAPELWWPVGYGDPRLYSLEVKLEDGQSLSKKIGFRKVQLLQTPLPTNDTDPYSLKPAVFYFEINNVPIFMKGANFIPIDSFHPRVTQSDRQYILEAARAANMNMVRVWGGGVYQADDFYEMADALGIMIWQEIMMACALYPRNREFLSEVQAEVEYQAIRLGSHPSIVVWGGNNENEVALGWFAPSQKNRDLYVSDYSELYGNTIYPTLVETLGASTFATQVGWVDSSPSNGLISTDPYAKLWGAASTATAGDVHFYNYACDCEDFHSYPEAKFISEFGFQTVPSFLTYEPVTAKEDWRPDSELMLYRQRHENGNSEIQGQLVKHFSLPNTCDDSDTQQRYYDMYLYLVGLQQSRCYETAINRWRQLRGMHLEEPEEQRYTMGILYWQLNDIWQGPSWSSMEYSGQWKPLHSAVQRAYAPVVITPSYQTPTSLDAQFFSNESTLFEVFGVNDRHEQEVKVALRIELKFWKGSALAAVLFDEKEVLLRADRSQLLAAVEISNGLLAKSGCNYATCYLKVSAKGEESHVSITPLAYMKDSLLPASTKMVFDRFEQVSENSIRFQIQVMESSPFLFFELRAPSKSSPEDILLEGVYSQNAGWFSENNFYAEAGQVYEITYTSYLNALTVGDFQQRLQARSLQHAYNCQLPLFRP